MSITLNKVQSNSDCKTCDFLQVNFSHKSRRTQYDKIIDYIKNNIRDLCESIELRALTRVGSESQYGEVYEFIQIPIENSVIKMLPLNTKDSFELNSKEITIACEASELVLKGISSHFPIVYDFGKCETFMGHKYKNVSSHFLISERASCDLYQYLTNKFPSKKQIQEIRKQCLQAIFDMHKYLGVCHNDLHLKNFLIMENDKHEVLVLIHDFGKAEYRETYTELDFEFFENEFSKFLV